jgi:hypothetical protein
MTSTHAASIRAARAARVRAIRHRVIAGAGALFVATWLLITLILVTGHDPALARQTKTKSAVTQTASQTAKSNTNTTTNSSTNTATSTTGATSSSTGSSGNSSSAVTSSQS